MAVLREVKQRTAVQIPVPYPAAYTAGWAVEDAPAGARQTPPPVLENGVLTFSLDGAAVRLTDSIHSGWLHASNGGNQMEMLNVQDGDFDLFTAASKLQHVYEDGTVCVYRITTPLCDRTAGTALAGAAAHTDLYFWKAQPLVSILTYFEASRYTPVREMALGNAAVTGKAEMTADGRWKPLGEQPTAANGGMLICRDLREFDAVHPFITHIAAAPCSLPLIRHETVSGDGPVLESGSLTVQLLQHTDGISLAAIRDKKGVASFDGAAGEPLFRLLLRDRVTGQEEMLTSESGWAAVRQEKTLAGYAFRFERPGIEVELTALPDAAKDQLAWEADVRLRDRTKTAVRFDPPAARMNAGDDVHIFFALGPGEDIPVSARGELHAMSPYPSIGVCMEYLAIYDAKKRRGIYCGFHDPQAGYKMLLADCHDGVCKTEALIPAAGIDEAANGFHMGGQVVWQLFDGDWYDATMLFRDWVHDAASWFRGIPATERPDVPEWLLKMPVWFRSDVDHKAWMEHLFEAQDDFAGIPVGVHIYQWHKIPFDTNYPHYAPAKEEFIDKLPVLQAHGLKVMPYINGRLWDTHDRGDYDYQFTSVARPGATKGRSGEVITEHYESRNSRGERVELAVMCPSTAVWQEKQMEVNDWILNTLGTDAVYVDQIAAAPPVTCMDPTHSHRRGGGSWWYEHYYNLIDHLDRRAGGDKCYTTESNAEPFTGHIGGMLVWHWCCADQVPAYPAVYAGYQPTLGRNYGAFPNDTVGFRIMTAQSLCFGDQPGWLTPEEYLASPYRAFFREIVRLRWQYNEYFYAGRCLRPPLLEGDVGTLDGPSFGSAGVLSALWERRRDGSRIAVLVNLTDETRTVRVTPDGAEPFTVTLAPAAPFIREL